VATGVLSERERRAVARAHTWLRVYRHLLWALILTAWAVYALAHAFSGELPLPVHVR
jgi:hypothetical protein